MTKVSIIIPTMNRPDFILRQFEFYELMDSPHPIYISDSSNEENAEKLKNGIKKFKKLNITYQWAPPGKDCLYLLLPLVKEKYCMQMGDDDIMIPKTISECADFLEKHPDYATCIGKQVNIRFRKEDYNKPYGIIERQTRPFGRSIEDEDMLIRAKHFWSDSFFICFVVTRVEVEREIRNITKHFSLMERVLEFLLVSILITSGKSKVIDRLGYIMQVSDNRYNFLHNYAVGMILSSDFGEKWGICEKGFSGILREKGMSNEESLKKVKWLFTIYLAYEFSRETGLHSDVVQAHPSTKKSLYKKVRNLIAGHYKVKKLFYKFKSLADASNVEATYFKDFETVKDFLEKNR